MATVPNPASQKPPSSETIVVPKMEGQTSGQNEENVDKTDTAGDAGDSEMQLVSSLAKLQKMEAMIHQLRTLLPGRLLEPLVPIVNPRKGSAVPKSPEILYEQLSQTARAGVAEVANFQSMWRGPEMKGIWDNVSAQIRENGGQLLQPTGMWERDYNVLLEELVKEEQTKQEQQQKAEEEMERSKIQSSEGDWKTIVETFLQKNVPGFRIACSNKDASFTAVLVKAGMALQAQAINGLGSGVPDWRVSNKLLPGIPKSKLEIAIADCLNSRTRQWDLAYLLDMISSYSDIKQTPCVKCNKMTDNAAQLPTIRQSKPSQSPQGQRVFIWEAYHPGCI
ncbi:hypothetical protein ASPWEDRAFT_115073 [Aspergillus wentii DTO 134E9]|uniref:Mediator complex subunit 27 n=1 Tax=Aspergillus wentii DTO 134E9 TaxID=1073089 RepID=A0A1L9REA2_ASPWE|nr:uncharacterized protein ASPWEDRAFT_115073 [Aspergillus wentii DTO 134E9]KAI9933488.1 hypothetical protein MW887_007961 [Aspergillus wentii]OJJ33234.1 hypothetical protein ASPWEDRAFT_115073 [Aspergillus wentii DTO 134E9]